MTAPPPVVLTVTPASVRVMRDDIAQGCGTVPEMQALVLLAIADGHCIGVERCIQIAFWGMH